MSAISDENLINEFVAESRDHLLAIEPDLLELERSGGNVDGELINRVFRAIHSIKGAAGFFGFEKLKGLSHVMENLLMLIREGKMTPTPGVIDPLLMGVDKLNTMVNDVSSSESVDTSEELRLLEGILSGDGATVPQPNAGIQATEASALAVQGVPEPTTFNPNPEALAKAVSHGQHMYVIPVEGDAAKVSAAETLLKSIGAILDQIPGATGTQFLFATVLEVAMLAEALVLPAEAFIPWTPDASVSKPSPGPVSQTQPVLAQPSDCVVTPMTSSVDVPQPKADLSKAVESARKATPSNESNESIRVNVSLLNNLMNLAGELVLSRNQLLSTMESQQGEDSRLTNIVQSIDMVTTNLQEHIMQTRMQPIGTVFGKFPRIVRDMAKMLGKDIHIEMSGEDVELDKSIIESLSDPLTHLIRNCCDHGIEMPDERRAAGKSAKGTIQLMAFHERGQINIVIADDGKGIDHERVARKVVSQGLMTEAELNKLSVQEMVNLIFLPGLSTADQVSEISGRGVGMDVVRTNIEKMGGHISIETNLGQGTTILLRLPLTLAIIPSLIVGASGLRFPVPQVNLVELVYIKASEVSQRIEKVGSASVLRLREKLLPLVRLSDVLGLPRMFIHPVTQELMPDNRAEIADVRSHRRSAIVQEYSLTGSDDGNRRQDHGSDYNILVLKSGAHQFGLVVDEFYDTEEIVVKALPAYLKSAKCFVGATILGDGQVTMILDVGGIVSHSKLSFADINAEARRREDEQSVLASSSKRLHQTIILFHNAMDEVFAMNLAAVLRLEQIRTADIKNVGSREFLTYRGQGLPLVRLEQYLSVRPSPHDLSEMFLIIPRAGNGAAGLLASKIIDVLDVDIELHKPLIEQSGVIGSAVLNDSLTTFIDPEALLQYAHVLV